MNNDDDKLTDAEWEAKYMPVVVTPEEQARWDAAEREMSTWWYQVKWFIPTILIGIIYAFMYWERDRAREVKPPRPGHMKHGSDTKRRP